MDYEGIPMTAAAAVAEVSFTLRMDEYRPPNVDYELHMSVLKQLLGQELREMIRSEMKSVLSDSNGQCSGPLLASFVEGPLLEDTVAKAAADSAQLGEQSFIEEQIKQVEEDGRVGSQEPEDSVAAPFNLQTGKLNRLQVTSDMETTANYLHDLSLGKRMDALTAEMEARTEAEDLAKIFPYFGKTIMKLDAIVSKIGNVSPPDRHDCVSRLADNWWFGVCTNVVTTANCVFLTYTADWEADNYMAEPPEDFYYIDQAFTAIFTAELAIRFWRDRFYFFFDQNYAMNLVDLVIVVGGLVDGILSETSDLNLTFIRALRTLKLLKVLRVLRILRMFKTLRVILESLQNTLADLFWCAVMLVMIQYMFALVFVMRTATYLHEEHETLAPEQIDELTQVFGSVPSAMLQLFTISMGGGDWAEDFELLSSLGALTQMIYLLFVAFSFIALLNVILGVFVDHAMKNLNPTKEEMARDHAIEEIQVSEDLKSLCREGDLDGDGWLSKQEWDSLFGRGKMTSYMDLMGFRAHDLRAFFELCAARAKDGRVEIEAFVRGCMRMRGTASCFDIQTMVVELHGLHKKLKTASDAQHQDLLNLHDFIRDQLAKPRHSQGSNVFTN